MNPSGKKSTKPKARQRAKPALADTESPVREKPSPTEKASTLVIPTLVVPGHDWMTTELVVKYVAEILWMRFGFAKQRAKLVVWEYGLVRSIVSATMHQDADNRVERNLLYSRLKTEAEATIWILDNARKLVEKLKCKKQALWLLLVGVEKVPPNDNLTKSGAIEEAAAKFFDVNEQKFFRQFERATRVRDDILRMLNDAKAQRISQIPSAGATTKRYLEVASQYPQVFELIEQRIREIRSSLLSSSKQTSTLNSLPDPPSTGKTGRLKK